MKKGIFIVMFAMSALIASAQTDYSNYLNKALEKLDAGDCESAMKNYNVYKELSGKSVSSVEILLKDCNREKNYSVGETMMVGDDAYIIAYVRDEGKHGLAIHNAGWQALKSDYQKYIVQKGIPTIAEMKMIYSNRDLVGLYDIYWVCDGQCSSCSCDTSCKCALDFSIGEFCSRCPSGKNGVILLIHRF